MFDVIKRYNGVVPLFYILRLYIERLFSLLYGCVRLFKITKIFISPSSVIKCSSHLRLGRGVTIARKCYIDAFSIQGLIIGNNVYVGQCSTIICTGDFSHIGKGIKIGDNVSLGTHGFYGGAGGVEIGNNTILGNYVSVHPANHNYSDTSIPICEQGSRYEGVKIGSGCWIGAKATILDGSIIGNNTVVAAGAVVTGKFSDNVVIAGVPAKIVKYIK